MSGCCKIVIDAKLRLQKNNIAMTNFVATHKKALILAGILLLAAFLRLYHFTATPPGLYLDEAMNGNNALEVAQTGHAKVYYSDNNGREGLYVNLLVPLVKAFGNKPWAIRIPSVVAGMLTVLGIYFLGSLLFNAPTGIFASFLLATSFWHVNFSRIGFRAILAPLMLVWALYFLIQAFRSQSKKTGIVYAIIAAILYAAGFYTYTSYRVTPLLLLFFIPFFRKSPFFWKRATLFVAITFIIALPIGAYFVQHPNELTVRFSEISITTKANPLITLASNIGQTALMFVIHGDNNWRHNIAGAPELFAPVAVLFVVGIILSIISLIKNRRAKKGKGAPAFFPTFSTTILFAWFIIGAIPAVMSNEGLPHAVRSILMLPPAILFAAIAGVWIGKTLYAKGFKKSIIVATVAFCAILCVQIYVSYFIVWAKNPSVYSGFKSGDVAIGNQINALPEDMPKYVIVRMSDVWVNGFPTSTQTVMFITNSFMESNRLQKHITYLLPEQQNQIPVQAPTNTIFDAR